MRHQLYFLRHATAELQDPTRIDQERVLIEKGYQQCTRVGAWLQRQQIHIDQVLCSPYPRAWQTATQVCQQAQLPEPEIQPWLALGTETAFAYSQLLQYLQAEPRQQKSTLLVGHEPDFSLLISRLLGMQTPALQIKKASICALEWQEGQCELAWLLPCRLMK